MDTEHVSLQWYNYYPQAGEADCRCSFCSVLVEDWETEIRIWSGDAKLSLVLHYACWVALSQAGYLTLNHRSND